MSYTKRDWDNTSNEVTKDDFKRIENGVEANDLEIIKQKNPTIPGTLARQISDMKDDEVDGSLQKQINDCLKKRDIPSGVTKLKDLPIGIYTGFNANARFADYPQYLIDFPFCNIQVTQNSVPGFPSKTIIITAVNNAGTIQKVAVGSIIGSMGELAWDVMATTETKLITSFESGWLQMEGTVATACITGKNVNVSGRIKSGSNAGGSVVCTLPYPIAPSVGQIIVSLHGATTFLGTARMIGNKLYMVYCTDVADVNFNFSYPMEV